ncbi:MAG TPA: DNA topoisomerase 3 [Bryobacteraceae bacterium]|nr:DNA topoisomerase 3 [Bryobacteraceae bacterium]
MSGSTESGTIAVLAEKPSVARDIARVLGAGSKGDGYLHGNGYVVTWAIGHLAALAQPHEIQPEWRSWRRNLLPMLPAAWPLVVYENTKDQFEVVRKILNSPKVSRIVCATDAGREGELIFRYIYEAAECAKPFSRLWISSLTPDAIRRGFDTLRPGRDYDPLADAARGRSRADWLVGMNLSRAYALAYNEKDLSVGRVQTPTLAMVVERELAVRNFVPEDYREVQATFHPTATPAANTYQGTWFRERPPQEHMRLAPDGEEAARIAERARTGKAAIESVEAQTQRMPPPALYDLTELQRHANRLFGFSAQKTLDLAQALYERHKLISYPRTDSRHLSQDVAQTLPHIVAAIAEPYREQLAPGSGERPLGRRFVDDSKVTDHHAIIPTTVSPAGASLNPDERKIYDLVCRRLLSAWHEDHIWSVTTVITAIRNGDAVDRYHTTGSEVRQIGWKVLDLSPPARKAKADDGPQALPAGLARDLAVDVVKAEVLEKKTRAPKRLTEATLLTAMETAGKTLDEKELSDAMKESGLGTPATRAATIEVLLKRGYIVREGKSLVATEKGIRLIEVVHPEVKSPVMTGQWEAYLQRIHRGKAQLAPFLKGIEDYVTDVVGKVAEVGGAAPLVSGGAPAPAGPATAKEAPSNGYREPVKTYSGTPRELLHSVFGFESFRANQEAVCQAVIDGQDGLLVMPTGAGKSLCYQLPGIVRGGTTLVISPLIALMEDQAAKLRERGLAVERIHSGRDRSASRQVCIDYLNGNLQFLFIAPERLRVPGFPEMLAKRKPNLIAIDEAHCISQWGHDFRPDYRMIGQYLPTLRPAPVIAMTATATPLVQDDIAEQLGIAQAARFIHGFRRDNLAVEVIEAAPSRRAALTSDLLQDESRRPAIVYAPTRKQATHLAAELEAHFPCAAYHAGLDADRRKRVQEQFLEGRLEVMVATIAFGMGIDKPNIRTVIHTALPGSLEAYYQEIGRAGRDGKPSRTILMHSYADRRTHDYFFERDYPDPSVLAGIFALLGAEPQDKAAVQRRSRMGEDDFDKALEKLWIHGGAVIDFAENITRGHDNWRETYIAQGNQKQQQLDLMLRFAESSECRMAGLVRHFGDFAGAQQPCGICDFCAPEDCAGQRFRASTLQEHKTAVTVMTALRQGGSKTTGRLYTELNPEGSMTRDGFEDVVGAMARAGLVRVTGEIFEKDGKSIPYRKVNLLDDREEFAILMKEDVAPAPRTRKGKKKKARAPRKPVREPKTAVVAAAAAPDEAIENALRSWRLAEAKRHGVPAFRIFSDKTLHALAASRPESAAQLLAIPGIGISIVEKYGAQLYRLLHDRA